MLNQHDKKAEGGVGFQEWRRYAEDDDLILKLLHSFSVPPSDFPTLPSDCVPESALAAF
jgi:hypothetical protein